MWRYEIVVLFVPLGAWLVWCNTGSHGVKPSQSVTAITRNICAGSITATPRGRHGDHEPAGITWPHISDHVTPNDASFDHQVTLLLSQACTTSFYCELIFIYTVARQKRDIDPMLYQSRSTVYVACPTFGRRLVFAGKLITYWVRVCKNTGWPFKRKCYFTMNRI